MLQLKNVNKYYKTGNLSFHALKDITIDFDNKGFVAILGESGSGKSTLLNVIAGLDIFDKGDLLIGGKSTKDFKEIEWDAYRNNHIGFVFQSYNLINHISALDNVAMSLTLQGVSKQEKNIRAKELLTSVGLVDQMNKLPNQMSGGQKQRIAIARALANNPDIILADEPTGALDSNTSVEIMELLKELSKEKLVIMVTHNEQLANQYATRIVKLKDGKIVDSGINEGINHEIQNSKLEVKRSKMNYLTALNLSYKNVLKKKWRTILTALGASIGIVGIAVMIGLGFGVSKAINKEVKKFIPMTQITAFKNDKSEFTQDEIDKISELDNVLYVQPNFGDIALLMKPYFESKTDKQDPSALIYQVPNDKSNFLKLDNIYGEYPKNDNEALLDLNVARSILGANFAKSDAKTLYNELKDKTDFTIKVFNSVTLDKKEYNIKIVGIVDFQSIMPYIYMTESFTLQAIKDQQSDPNQDVSIKAINVIINDEKNQDSVIKAINNIDTNYKAVSPTEQIMETVNKYITYAQIGLAGFAGVSLITSSIMIGIVLYISVLERTKEIGILRALGARRKDIRRLFLAETAIIGFLGGVIGVLGASIINLIGNLVLTAIKINVKVFTLPIYVAIGVILLSICVSMFAGLIPSNKGSKMNPIDALRHE